LPAPAAPEEAATPDNAASAGRAKPKEKRGPKRSTTKGEARARIVPALTKHHQYADGGCPNTEPIGVNELARQAEVAPSSVTLFFNKEFGGKERKDGHSKYQALCRRSAADLVTALKLLNGEFSPYLLYGSTPPGEGRDDE
jgi:hypothetical protein